MESNLPALPLQVIDYYDLYLHGFLYALNVSAITSSPDIRELGQRSKFIFALGANDYKRGDMRAPTQVRDVINAAFPPTKPTLPDLSMG